MIKMIITTETTTIMIINIMNIAALREHHKDENRQSDVIDLSLIHI